MYNHLVRVVLHMLTQELLNVTTHSSNAYFTTMLTGVLDINQLSRMALNVCHSRSGCQYLNASITYMFPLMHPYFEKITGQKIRSHS
jgi:hypothetical protein